jgi:predicted DNA-binding mobile mystery protein A
MTTRQLAERLSIGQSAVVALEKSEAEERITLQSLRRAAQALDCELHYVLVPRQPLEQQIDQRAEAVAKKTIDSVMHTMSLEDQTPSSERSKKMTIREKERVLASRWSRLWER